MSRLGDFTIYNSKLVPDQIWARMNSPLPLDWDCVPVGGARQDGLMSAGGANTCPPAVNWQMASVALVAASRTGGAPVLT